MASTALATARYVLPVPAGPMPKVISKSCIFFKYAFCLVVLPLRSLRFVLSSLISAVAFTVFSNLFISTSPN